MIVSPLDGELIINLVSYITNLPLGPGLFTLGPTCTKYLGDQYLVHQYNIVTNNEQIFRSRQFSSWTNQPCTIRYQHSEYRHRVKKIQSTVSSLLCGTDLYSLYVHGRTEQPLCHEGRVFSPLRSGDRNRLVGFRFFRLSILYRYLVPTCSLSRFRYHDSTLI